MKFNQYFFLNNLKLGEEFFGKNKVIESINLNQSKFYNFWYFTNKFNFKNKNKYIKKNSNMTLTSSSFVVKGSKINLIYFVECVLNTLIYYIIKFSLKKIK